MNDDVGTRSGKPPAAPGVHRWDGAELAERRARVFELRKLKVPFRAIAAELGISVGRAHADYRQAMLDLLPVEDVEEMRRADLDLLDHAIHLQLKRLEPVAQPLPEDPELAGLVLGIDVDKILGTLMRLMERRARLAGLDRPVESLVTVAGTVTVTGPADVARMRDELAERRGARAG